MRVLALESSGRTGSVALAEVAGDGLRPIGRAETDGAERTAQALVPAIERTLAQAGWRPRDVELVCVTTGPGSFTGLRIGVVTAKTLAYAVGAKLAGVHTLAAIAAGVEQPYGRLWTVLDAQRQELFVARFDGGRAIADQAAPVTEILSVADLAERLAPGDAIAGPPLATLSPQLPGPARALEPSCWAPAAAVVARLGWQLYQRGRQENPLQLVPHYFRKSAAEEKAARANRSAP